MESEKDFLDLIKPYNKHNVYTKKYAIDEYGRVLGIPATARWTVLKYVGSKGNAGFFKKDGEGVVALILNDVKNQFWTVISFLTDKEAVELAHLLLKAVGAYGVKLGEVDA